HPRQRLHLHLPYLHQPLAEGHVSLRLFLGERGDLVRVELVEVEDALVGSNADVQIGISGPRREELAEIHDMRLDVHAAPSPNVETLRIAEEMRVVRADVDEGAALRVTQQPVDDEVLAILAV